MYQHCTTVLRLASLTYLMLTNRTKPLKNLHFLLRKLGGKQPVGCSYDSLDDTLGEHAFSSIYWTDNLLHGVSKNRSPLEMYTQWKMRRVSMILDDILLPFIFALRLLVHFGRKIAALGRFFKVMKKWIFHCVIAQFSSLKWDFLTQLLRLTAEGQSYLDLPYQEETVRVCDGHPTR